MKFCTVGKDALALTCRLLRPQVEMLQFLATVARGPAQKVEVRELLDWSCRVILPMTIVVTLSSTSVTHARIVPSCTAALWHVR